MYLEILAGHTSQKAQVCKFYESNTLDCKEAVLVWFLLFLGGGLYTYFQCVFWLLLFFRFV